jgi:hypothetical protein
MNRARSAQRKRNPRGVRWQNVELVPQYQDFRFELASRFEAVAQQRTKRSPIAIMRRSCSDSLLIASQMD